MQELTIYDDEGYGEDALREALQKELQAIQDFKVYEEVDASAVLRHASQSLPGGCIE